MPRKKVIFVTDGDTKARHVVEEAARRIGGRCISASAGNPSPLEPQELLSAIHSAAGEPVLVMVDDCGLRRKGPGEAVLEALIKEPSLNVMGVLAVASDTSRVEGVPVIESVARTGRVIDGPVDKDGYPEPDGHAKVEGDTVDVLNRLDVPVIVGIGDLGKQDDADDSARITTRAIEEIMRLAGDGDSAEPTLT